MRRQAFWLATGGLVLAMLLAGGCGRPGVVAVAPAPAMPREAFVYQPIPPPKPRPVPVEEPAQPLTLEIPAPRPAVPHEVAWEPAAAERPWRWIVIHHSATDTGSAAAFDAWHRNGRHWDELGYHFVIGNGGGTSDGLVEVGSRWPKQKYGAHCRVGDNEEYNYFGIGICLVGDFEKRRPTEAQMASLARLVGYLADRYHIDERHIIGHSTVDDTRCPGRNFSFPDLFARLRRSRAAREDVAGPAAPAAGALPHIRQAE
jgi:hypothetical protein